jgi:predicted lipoprotein with Yx(FWY)xxD motif
MSPIRLLCAALLCASTLAACGRDHARQGDRLLELAVPRHTTVDTRTVPGLGPILTDDRGRTLYLFPPDAKSRVSCTGPCAGTWPPLVIAPGGRPTPGTHVRGAELGTVADPNSGARVVTYAGYPLYRYAGDIRAGTANGQDLFLNGGPWYVINPDGQPVTSAYGDS